MPGVLKISKAYIATSGCNNVRVDAKIMGNALTAAGYEVIDNPLKANLILYLACGARADTEQRSIDEVSKLVAGKNGSRLVVSGCLPAIDRDRLDLTFGDRAEIVPSVTLPDYLGIRAQFQEAQLDDLSLKQPSGSYLSDKEIAQRVSIRDRLMQVDETIARYYEATTPGILFGLETNPPDQIVIARGCYYRCSYCVIWKGRGDFQSVDPGQIVEKVRNDKSKGLVLTADESGNYGLDLSPKVNLTVLLEKIRHANSQLEVPHHFYLRNLEPSPFEVHKEAVLDLSKEGVLYHLCVPLQSASRDILKNMRREYDPTVTLDLLLEAKSSGTIIETHMMVGFPGETDGDFDDSMEFIKKLKPDNLSVIPYSDRPGAPASDMPDKVEAKVKLERSEVMIDLLKEQVRQRYSHLIPGNQDFVTEIASCIR